MKEYISSLIGAMTRFQEITHIHVIPGEGSIEAAAVGRDKSILLKATGAPIKEFPAPICLGNLKYLQKILSVEQLKASAGVEFQVGPALDKSEIVRAIDFSGPRLKIRYESTDPSVGDNNVATIPKILAQDWPCVIKLEPAHHKEFNEAVSLQKITNPTKNEFKVTSKDGNLVFVFETGERSADKDIELTVGPAEGELIEPIYFNIGRFASLLSLMSDAKGGILSISKFSLKMEFVLDEQEYLAIMPKMNTATSR